MGKDPEKAEFAGNWCLDYDGLEKMFTSKTKALIINNPHNPTGKVYTLEELTKIADLVKKYDCLCIADEVYEHIVYDDNVMHRMATIDGMWDRTFTIGSAGKTFSVTGWK